MLQCFSGENWGWGDAINQRFTFLFSHLASLVFNQLLSIASVASAGVPAAGSPAVAVAGPGMSAEVGAVSAVARS